MAETKTLTGQPGWKHNVNLSDVGRVAAIVGGGALALAGMRRKSAGGLALAFLGGGLVYKVATDAVEAHKNKPAHLPYRGGVVIEESIVIDKSPEELFAFWRNFENLPCFMEHLIEVTVNNDETSHWVAKGPLGMRVEWYARIINEVANDMIAWRSLDSSNIDHTGSVHFEPMSDGSGTMVRVVLRYDPPAKHVGAAIARLFGEEPALQVADDLKRFKQLMETGEVATSTGQTGGIARVESRDMNWPGGMNPVHDKVHQMSEDSFPASDPPSSY